MNIVFFHGNGILPNFGGISRITDILGNLFVSKGNNVWYIGAQDKHKGQKYSVRQSFLPSVDLFSDDNLKYIAFFVREHKVDAIINQCALDPNSAKFLALCREKAPFLLVSCFHNSILTPILNGAYQKEYLLKRNGLGWVFNLMNTCIVRSIMTRLYIHKHRKRYLSTFNNSDYIVVLCNGQIPELYRMCGLKSSNKVCVIPNGIDTNVTSAENKEKIVLWVGTFDYSVKRPDNMLRIWKIVEEQHPDWSLLMLGDGPSWKEMQQMSKSLGLRHVFFKGRIVPDEYYKKAVIACVTSVHESFSMVIVEAQRVGCIPVVNNSFTSIPMLIEDRVNGCIVKAFDNTDFAKVLSTLMDDHEKQQQISRRAVENAKRFSLDNIYEQWKMLLNKNNESVY